MDSDLNLEKKKLYLSIAKSLIVVSLIWLSFLLNDIFSLNWDRYGMQPRTLRGLWGIITMPFLHNNMQHLLSNTLPLLFLSFGLFYFFRKKSLLILIMLNLVTGILLWATGRDGNHIGASGLVYALGFFLATISLIKRENSLLAYTLIIVFLYGSLVWGFFPQLFPDKSISWEGHLCGAVSGMILAIFYRKEGPQRKQYFLDEEDDPDEEEIDAYWK